MQKCGKLNKMAIFTKIGNILTLILMGYEANNAINDDKDTDNKQIVIKREEITAEKVISSGWNDHEVILCILIVVVVMIVLAKLYKRLMKDVSNSVVNA